MFASAFDSVHDDGLFLVVNVVKDAILTDADAVALLSGELLCSRGSRVFGEVFQPGKYSTKIGRRYLARRSTTP